MDHGIGRIIDKLRQAKQYENTLIVFYSDNGATLMHGGSNGPLRGSKGMLFEGGIRVPFLISWPKKIPPNLKAQFSHYST